MSRRSALRKKLRKVGVLKELAHADLIKKRFLAWIFIVLGTIFL